MSDKTLDVDPTTFNMTTLNPGDIPVRFTKQPTSEQIETLMQRWAASSSDWASLQERYKSGRIIPRIGFFPFMKDGWSLKTEFIMKFDWEKKSIQWSGFQQTLPPTTSSSSGSGSSTGANLSSSGELGSTPSTGDKRPREEDIDTQGKRPKTLATNPAASELATALQQVVKGEAAWKGV